MTELSEPAVNVAALLKLPCTPRCTFVGTTSLACCRIATESRLSTGGVPVKLSAGNGVVSPLMFTLSMVKSPYACTADL